MAQDHFNFAMVATDKRQVRKGQEKIICVMFTPNPNKNPCKLVQFDNLDESTGRWTKTKTAALPCPIEHTRVLNCFILATDEVLVVVDEALIFLDQELNSLHFCQLETNFVYISCLAEGLPVDG